MTDLLAVTYRTAERLPANAVVIIETVAGRTTIWLSGAHPLELVTAHLTAACDRFRDVNGVRALHLAS